MSVTQGPSLDRRRRECRRVELSGAGPRRCEVHSALVQVVVPLCTDGPCTVRRNPRCTTAGSTRVQGIGDQPRGRRCDTESNTYAVAPSLPVACGHDRVVTVVSYLRYVDSSSRRWHAASRRAGEMSVAPGQTDSTT